MALFTVRKSNQAWLAVGLLTFAATTAPIFIRFAQDEGVPSLSIIAIRLILGTLILTPFAWQQHRDELTQMSRHDWGWAMAAGAFHAVSLFFLFFALENTSVLVNSVLRRTSPLWTMMLEMVLLHTLFSRQVWLGIVISLLGSGLVAFSGAAGVEMGTRPLLGAGLSMLNAITLSIYLIIGRKLRDKLSFLTYTWILFLAASLVALFFVLVTRTPLIGYSLVGYGWVLVVTIVAQLIGHLPINFAVRHFQATQLSVLLQMSVAASALMAFIYFGEIPSWLQVTGSFIILIGVTMVTMAKQR